MQPPPLIIYFVEHIVKLQKLIHLAKFFYSNPGNTFPAETAEVFAEMRRKELNNSKLNDPIFKSSNH